MKIEIETCDICQKIIDPGMEWNGKNYDITDNYFNITEWGDGEDLAIYVCEGCCQKVPMADVIDCRKKGLTSRRERDKFIREKFKVFYESLQSELDLL